MAKFIVEPPDDVIKDLDFLAKHGVEIFGGMTQAGAKVARKHIETGARKAFDNELANKMNPKLKTTRVYFTKDGGINTKVAYYGYIPLKDKDRVVKIRKYKYVGRFPVPFLVTLREYGGSGKGLGNMPEQLQRYWKGSKYAFVRPAFEKKSEIEQAMKKAQKKLSGGILDD